MVAGKLCAPFGLHGAMHRHYYANTSPSSTHSTAIAEFRAWLVEEGRAAERAIDIWAGQ